MDLSEKPSGLPCIAFVCREAYEISKLYVKEYRVDFTHIFSVQWMEYLYTTTRIRFDPVLDTLLVNYSGATSDDDPVEGHLEHETYLEGLRDGPYALAMSPKVNIVLDMDQLVGPRRDDTLVSDIRWLTTRPYSDCLTQRSHCTIRLATTKLTTTSQEIRSSGLFGMFGEERNVLIDIKDTAKIDRYEDYVYQLFPRVRQNFTRSCNYFPEAPGDEPLSGDLACIGAGRYGTDYGADEGVRTDDWHTRDDDSEEPPTVFSTLAEKDAANAHALIKQTWLESHHCFEPADKPALPWTGNTKYRKWDDEHHVAKHWLSKLPTFSFVVMYTVSEED